MLKSFQALRTLLASFGTAEYHLCLAVHSFQFLEFCIDFDVFSAFSIE